MRRYRSGTSGMLVGGLIVAIGLVLLLDNMGVIRFHDVWRYWPILLIVWGVSRILESGGRTGAYVWGGVVALIGSLLLLDNLDIWPFDFNVIWPLMIIGFGVSMLLRALDRKKYVDGISATGDPVLGIFAIFSGVKRRIDSPDFKGGDIVAIFGGVSLDFRKAVITGDRAAVDVSAIFGGVELRVPEEWSVIVKGTGVFGAFEDKTIQPRRDPNVKTPELVVTGSAIFGGTKVEN